MFCVYATVRNVGDVSQPIGRFSSSRPALKLARDRAKQDGCVAVVLTVGGRTSGRPLARTGHAEVAAYGPDGAVR